jgi:hypothetical protein
MSPEWPYEIFGHPSWPKGASRRASAHCLRPKAEFARSSGCGLRRVKNIIQAAKGICKKAIKSEKIPAQKPEDPYLFYEEFLRQTGVNDRLYQGKKRSQGLLNTKIYVLDIFLIVVYGITIRYASCCFFRAAGILYGYDPCK